MLVQSYLCPASQNDVSVYKNLLFMSSEATNSRADCGFGGVPEPVSKDARARHPRLRHRRHQASEAGDQRPDLPRIAHAHGRARKPGDNDNVYIYVSGTAGVRSADEVPGCADGGIDDPNTARFRLEVIKVPLAAPETGGDRQLAAHLQRSAGAAARAHDARRAATRGRARGSGGARAEARGAPAAAAGGRGRGNGRRTGRRPVRTSATTSRCIRRSASPAARAPGLGLLLDIRDVGASRRASTRPPTPNMSFWHSATFNNDGNKILFTDEWGGGGQPRCRATDKMEWGADALFTIENNKLKFHTLLQAAGARRRRTRTASRTTAR